MRWNQKEAGCGGHITPRANLSVNMLRKQVEDERVVQMVKWYLNEFDWECKRWGVPCIRYADDIVLLAKSERATERLLESSTKYLERTRKLKVNWEKSRTISVFAIRNFKIFGFCFGKNRKESTSVSMESHGRKSRINCTSSLRGAGAGVSSEPWRR